MAYINKNTFALEQLSESVKKDSDTVRNCKK